MVAARARGMPPRGAAEVGREVEERLDEARVHEHIPIPHLPEAGCGRERAATEPQCRRREGERDIRSAGDL